jgi:dolichol-phosphate mannosyltransferase
MQHPPSLIPEFVKVWESGADIVAGVRSKNQSQSRIKSVLSKNYYRLMSVISEVHMESGETDFRLMDRVVVDAFKKLPERQRMTRTLINWLGFTREKIYFEADERAHGEAQYSMIKLARLALHSIVTNSLFPLRLVSYLGLFISVTSFIVGTAVFIQRYMLNDYYKWSVTGTAQLALILVFLVGVILMALGMIALYIENIHKEALRRPLYIARRKNTNDQMVDSTKKKIGVCFSAFDLLHPGHAAMLADARSQCEYLIVGIQSDPTLDVEYRMRTGSKNKPIYTLDERIDMIKAIKYVDEYFIYTTEDELYKWLESNHWDVRILGSDWEGKEFTGHDIKKGNIYFHKRVHNLSSTEIRRRLSNNE